MVHQVLVLCCLYLIRFSNLFWIFWGLLDVVLCLCTPRWIVFFLLYGFGDSFLEYCCMHQPCLFTQQLSHIVPKNKSVWQSQTKKNQVPLFFLRHFYALFVHSKNLHIPFSLMRFFMTAVNIFLILTVAMFLFEYIFHNHFFFQSISLEGVAR